MGERGDRIRRVECQVEAAGGRVETLGQWEALDFAVAFFASAAAKREHSRMLLASLAPAQAPDLTAALGDAWLTSGSLLVALWQLGSLGCLTGSLAAWLPRSLDRTDGTGLRLAI